MDNLTAGLAIIGLVNGIRLLQEPLMKPPLERNYWGFILFVCAMVSGMIFGYWHWFGLPTVEAGFLAGLASSGLYRVGEKVSGR